MQRVDAKEQPRKRELRVLEQWKENNTFQQSIKEREGAEDYVLYEGPPTANGKPHVGHVLGRVIKDFIARYKTMSGYRVLRKAGWDTHGLPVELEVEKALGISGKKEIEDYGVEAFVKKCRESVFEYERQWREMTDAIGYWVDMDDPYVTLHNEYIESVWAILADIHKKGLMEKAHRVSPYCPSCQTTLSSHEVAQGYEDVKDLSVTVKFRAKESDDIFLGWTTTPWTLPANVALAVNEEMEYVRVKQNDETYIVAKALLEKVIEGEYEVLSTHRGSEFIGMHYEPLFRFVDIEHGHFVIAGDFVTEASGTGIVHIAPAHGEDDYRVSRVNNLSMIQVVNDAGCYTDDVDLFAGRFVKDCDVDIVKHLAHEKLLYSKEKYEHSYPFCWRCKTPLLYHALDSWIIKTTEVKEQLIANNQQIEWYPDHLRDGRFGNFLDNLIDWNIGRNRYWGTPLNVWVCTDCGHQHAPGSVAELQKYAAHDVDASIELHKPYIDEVKLSCTACEGTMERTPEVIDVWFDSGAMPFAQYHYPFANKELQQKQFPADMICEAIDQTRGWFYSLLAVSTLYTGKAPYKRVVSTGHILDEDGRKMSKSKGNVIDPWELIEELGADALRWALLSGSAPWHSKRFSKQLVAEAKSKLIDTLVNTVSFYTLYATIDGYDPQKSDGSAQKSVLDRWILSRLHSTIAQVRSGLDTYDFLNPARRLEAFVDDLSNWYIRRSRDRFWGSGMNDDKLAAYDTLHEVLVQVSKLLAPYTPFLADDLYRHLGYDESVHLVNFPRENKQEIDTTLEQKMADVRQVVEAARSIRNQIGIKTRQPLSELVLIPNEGQSLAVDGYEAIIRDEINVKSIRFSNSDAELMDVSLKLDFKSAGPKFGKAVQEVAKHVQSLNAEDAREAVENGKLHMTTADGTELEVTADLWNVQEEAKSGFAVQSEETFSVALNTTITEELKQEGLVREVIRVVQDYRKKLDLPVEKRIHLVLDVEGELKTAISRFESVLQENVLIHRLEIKPLDNMERVTIGEHEIGMAVPDA